MEFPTDGKVVPPKCTINIGNIFGVLGNFSFFGHFPPWKIGPYDVVQFESETAKKYFGVYNVKSIDLIL